MASQKAEKSEGTQLLENEHEEKKEPHVKASRSNRRSPATKLGPKKTEQKPSSSKAAPKKAEKKPQEPKKKAIGARAAAKK